jgi:hypothetical protein
VSDGRSRDRLGGIVIEFKSLPQRAPRLAGPGGRRAAGTAPTCLPSEPVSSAVRKE